MPPVKIGLCYVERYPDQYPNERCDPEPFAVLKFGDQEYHLTHTFLSNLRGSGRGIGNGGFEWNEALESLVAAMWETYRERERAKNRSGVSDIPELEKGNKVLPNFPIRR